MLLGIDDITIWVLGLAGVAVVQAVAIIVLWRRQCGLLRVYAAMTNMVQQQERTLAQQDYAIAMLRQSVTGGEQEPYVQKTDQEHIEAALDELDKQVAEEVAAEPEEADEPTDDVLDDVTSARQENAEPVVQTKPDIEPAEKMSHAQILQSLRNAIQSNAMAISRQPIVSLPERSVKYYEIFMRMDIGGNRHVPAHTFISIARDHNLIGTIDTILLLRCLQMVKATASTKPSADFFINISGQTLSNKNYIRSLIDFLTANPALASRLIFELTQEDSMHIAKSARQVIDGLSMLGCRFSMDQVKILGMDVDRLIEQRISFVKLDARSLQKDMDIPSNRNRINKIKTTLNTHGIQVIIEKVENEKQFYTTLELQSDLGQGYFFGNPELLA